MAKPNPVVSLFATAHTEKPTSPDAILSMMQSRAAEKNARWDKVHEAIHNRSADDVAWELLGVAVTDICEKGATPLGRTALSELLRIVVTLNKNSPQDDVKDSQILDVKDWLRKKAE